MAHMWSNIATAQLNGEERSNVEKQRDYIASKMKPEQVTKAQELARNWKPKS